MSYDITAIFLTNNEVPERWMRFHNQVLLESLCGAPLITMSRKPMNLGGMNILQDKPKSMSNIYWQLLRGAKLAKTDYIAVVEDDTLYPEEHFKYRPDKNKIGYNMNHWHLFTWGTPMYSWRNRRGNYSMLSYRELVIKALEERFAKYPNGTPDKITGELGRQMVENNLGVAHLEVEEFETLESIINFNHDEVASDPMQREHRKSWGNVQALHIPRWGKASELVKKWK
jgi:hypothetical protein